MPFDGFEGQKNRTPLPCSAENLPQNYGAHDAIKTRAPHDRNEPTIETCRALNKNLWSPQ